MSKKKKPEDFCSCGKKWGKGLIMLVDVELCHFPAWVLILESLLYVKSEFFFIVILFFFCTFSVCPCRHSTNPSASVFNYMCVSKTASISTIALMRVQKDKISVFAFPLRAAHSCDPTLHPDLEIYHIDACLRYSSSLIRSLSMLASFSRTYDQPHLMGFKLRQTHAIRTGPTKRFVRFLKKK
jgi:hypothetical protein